MGHKPNIFEKMSKIQCFGFAYVYKRIWIQDPKKVHTDTDPRG